MYFKSEFTDVDIGIDGKTYRMIHSIVPDPENDLGCIEAIPDYCAR